MIKQVHLRLSLLFTIISSIIIIGMSLGYLFISETSLKENTILSFQNDINNIVTTLENQSVISYEWIAKLEKGKKCSIFLFDNDILLSYGAITKSEKENILLEDAKDFIEEKHKLPLSSQFSSVHYEKPFDSSAKSYLSYAKVPKKNGLIECVILFSLEPLSAQINRQRIHFLVLDICAIILIALFSFFYTEFLLKPIEENTKKQRQFIASASHELRTPLSIIRSSLSAIKKAKEHEKDDFFKIIEEESANMSHLIDDMLTLANSDNHTWQMNKELTEADTMLVNCWESFLVLAGEQKKQLSISLPEEAIPRILCDKMRISQVLSIFLHNALSYTQIGGNIKVSLTYSKHIFYFTIADNGIGISNDDKAHIFERFYRAESSRTQKEESSSHFGLGLCIAKEIVSVHHGNIFVEDNSPCGTIFTVAIPENQ